MIYVYDFLLNWTDTKRVYEFFEWKEDDCIEHIKRIPLIKITTEKMNDVLTNQIKITEELMNKLLNKAEVYQSKSTTKIKYALILTDKNRVVAIEFSKEGKSICRSFLDLEDEEEVLDVASNLDIYDFKYQKLSTLEEQTYETRKELSMKKYLINEIKKSYRNHHYNKIYFLYNEYFDQEEEDIKNCYNKLINTFNEPITHKHHELYNVIKLSHNKKASTK